VIVSAGLQWVLEVDTFERGAYTRCERRRILPCRRPDMIHRFYYFSGGTTELLVTQ